MKTLRMAKKKATKTGNDGGYYVETDLKKPLKLNLDQIGSKITGGGSYRSTESDGTKTVILTCEDDQGYQSLLLRCYLNDQGEVYKIGSARPPIEIATKLSEAMGSAGFNELKESLPDSSKLSLQYSDQDKVLFEANVKKSAANKQLISTLNQLPKAPESSISLTPNNTRGVGQAEIMEVRAQDNQHTLASFGAGPCVIVAAYSPSLGKVVMAHVDAFTNIDSVKQAFDQRLNGASDIQLHFAGGDSSSREQSGDLVAAFADDNRYSVKSADIVRNSGSASLAIDAKTGKISAGVEPTQIDAGTDFDMRMKLIPFRQPNSPLNTVSEKVFKYPEKDRLPANQPEQEPAIKR